MKQPIPFGKYYLLERVNVGGMAEVYKAKATGVEGFERLVAVKRILPSIAEDEEFITMFIDEAKIAVQLTHASIAQIFDLGRVDESYFIALEYVYGKDVRAVFNRARNRGEPLPVPMACFTTMKVCEGLDYAHNKKDPAGRPLQLVHRDVSPQNILISYEGEVKIIDFGIAKAAGKAGKTQAGILKGKFGYMSPEQVKGMDLDRRSDIFGVGICLYELLTGERLFVGESDFSTLEKVRNVDIMPPSTYNRRIPEELEQIVLKALARDREERYQTAMELHDDLQSFMYTSGNFFGRKDLSAYMRKVFAEELEKESARDAEYEMMGIPSAPSNENTGLHAFDNLEPVSTVSALHDADAPSSRAANVSPQALPAQRRQPTLLGMPAARPQTSAPSITRRSAPSVPPPSPRPESIPPQRSRPPSPRAPGSSPRLDMDWDDEELSTQIYDKPEDVAAAITGTPHPHLASTPRSLAPAVPTPSRAPSVPPPAPRTPAPASTLPRHSPAPAQAARSSARLREDPTDVLTSSDVDFVRSPASPGKGAVYAGAAAIAVVMVIALVMLIFNKPAAGTIRLTTVPKDALVKIDGIPVLGNASPFVVGNVQPDVSHVVEISKDGYRTWSQPVAVQPGQSFDLSVPLDPLQADTGFAIDSQPSGARVFVDGREIARTPFRITNLSAGLHTIRIDNGAEYSPYETAINVTANQVVELPTAELLPVRKAPETRPEPIPEPRREGRADVDSAPRRPRPPPSEPRAQRAPVAPAGRGVLRINSRPWSQVFVDGQLIGNTPQMNVPLSAGSHRVTLVNPDFGIRETVTVTIRADEVTTKIVTLAPGS